MRGGQTRGQAKAKNPSSMPSHDKIFTDCRVGILGAGMAGLGAASELRKKGVKVTVFEPRDRVGGRVHSVDAGGVNGIDQGASFIHGVDGNPVKKLADQFKLETYAQVMDKSKRGDDNIVMVDFNGFAIPADKHREVQEKYDNAMIEAEEAASDLPMSEQLMLSTGGAMEQYKAKEEGLARRVWEWHESQDEYSTGADHKALSLKQWHADDETAYPGPHVMIKDGYQKIPEKLAEGVDVQFGVAVRKVCRVGDKVLLYKSGQLEPIGEFDFVIDTCPLGVLKKSVEAAATGGSSNRSESPTRRAKDNGTVTYEPPLPQWKTEAIDRLGVGLLNKVWLVFDEVWWDQATAKRHIGYCGQEKGWFFEFILCHPKPAILALLPAELGKKSEAMDDNTLKKQCLQVLRKVYGKQVKVPEPTHFMRTKWGQDIRARGSYSYIPPGSSCLDYDLLSMPVGRCLFAGEHTCKHYPATVHGAYHSGVREAQRIIDAIAGGVTSTQGLHKWFVDGSGEQWIDAGVDAKTEFDAKTCKEDSLTGLSHTEHQRLMDGKFNCSFCGGAHTFERPLVGVFETDDGQRHMAHEQCLYSSTHCVSNTDGSRWFNAASAIKEARKHKCVICKKLGATLKCCHASGCKSRMHLACASEQLGYLPVTKDNKKHRINRHAPTCPKHTHTHAPAAASGRRVKKPILKKLKAIVKKPKAIVKKPSAKAIAKKPSAGRRRRSKRLGGGGSSGAGGGGGGDVEMACPPASPETDNVSEEAVPESPKKRRRGNGGGRAVAAPAAPAGNGAASRSPSPCRKKRKHGYDLRGC
ncbi:unnamed protein product [Vitrella brassicaformis CCMP3155]|uniref:Amine oxidase domain-containing protein n=2 Tax=Vitrella brassicaformis TaxID=1169539 RepID=A0A0G4G9H8_VITBC|nr:unnamed protein product [Vitrella brassicaformis CCMP3155]|eukprot:CEM25339.1 unnamed protein product [Vitrella brassicaformis CCMP3155]